jgi:hypothetical protein
MLKFTIHVLAVHNVRVSYRRIRNGSMGCKVGQIASSPRVEDCVGCKDVRLLVLQTFKCSSIFAETRSLEVSILNIEKNKGK